MTLAATIDENGQLTLPQEIREQLDLSPNSQVEFTRQGSVVTLSKKLEEPEISSEERVRRVEAAVEKYGGTMRAQMLADGYQSVDEYMDEIRPPW